MVEKLILNECFIFSENGAKTILKGRETAKCKQSKAKVFTHRRWERRFIYTWSVYIQVSIDDLIMIIIMIHIINLV